MKRFCIECGKEISDEHKVCINCGAKQPEREQENQPASMKEEQGSTQRNSGINKGSQKVKKEDQVEKKPSGSKNNKKIIAAVGIILLIFLVHMGLKSYYSLENVEERFNKALEGENTRTVKKLVSHEGGEEVKDIEMDALFKLMASNEGPKPSYRVEETGKKFFFYPDYKFYYMDQYAYYNSSYEGLECTFNGEDFLADEGQDYISYGPFLPGIYQAELEYNGDMGEISEELDVVIFDEYESIVYLDDIFQISTVRFGVNNYNDWLGDKVYIEFNDKKIKLGEYGETEEVGPVFINAKPSFEIVSDLPWGEIHTNPIKIEDYQAYGDASFVDDEQYEDLTEMVLNFSEEYLQALAKKSTDSLTDVSSGVKKLVTDYIERDYNYMGRVEKVQFNRDDIRVLEDEDSGELFLRVPSVFHISESVYSDDVPILDEYDFAMNMELAYTDDSKWQIQNFERNSYASMEATKTLEGSKELYTSEEGAEESVTTRQLQDNLNSFIDEYETAYVDSINFRDFDLVEEYLDSDGPRHKEVKDYLVYLEEKGITEKYYGMSIRDIETVDDKSWKISYVVDYDIIKSDETNYKSFDTTVLIKEKDGSYYVNELVDTKEIE